MCEGSTLASDRERFNLDILFLSFFLYVLGSNHNRFLLCVCASWGTCNFCNVQWSSRLRYARWSALASACEEFQSGYIFPLISLLLGAIHNKCLLCGCFLMDLKFCKVHMSIRLRHAGRSTLTSASEYILSSYIFPFIYFILGSNHITCYSVGASYGPCDFTMCQYLVACSSYGALPLPLLAN